ncbi:MAG: ribulose-phosphate 3-epimerase [Planctomycetes bacterium]|nr:ribulose-phosphate 3-epimerase [Planctomycetota bacterium]
MRLPKTGTVEVSPSILSADFSKLASEIAEVEAAGIKMLHLDIMDGHFVPNMSFGAPVVAKLRKCSKLVFDTHLMITDPGKYAEDFVKAGSDHITFHIETVDEPEKFIEYLRSLGVTVGVCLNPETPVEAIEKVITLCDMVLVMTVHPGFGGQELIDEAARKCTRIREIAGANIRIEVDGGIDPVTTPTVISYGADTLVAGNAIFGKTDRKAAINAIMAGSN